MPDIFNPLMRGDKVNVHLSLYEAELDVIDDLCSEHRCSRAAVIGAWVQEYSRLKLKNRVKAGNRPGAGRPKKEPY
jgi:hypothetical protein